VHLRDALPPKNKVDRLFDDPHAECVRPDKQFREKRKVIVFERQRSKHPGSVDAKSGSLVFDRSPNTIRMMTFKVPLKARLPGWSAVRTSTLDEPRADQDVGTGSCMARRRREVYSGW